MSYWCVVKAVAGHDRLALASVTLAGFETFAPKTRVQVGAKWRTAPLFTTYFFARIEERWRAVERSLGVANVVKFGVTPAKVPDAEIAKLLARADADGVVRLAPHLSPRPITRSFAPGAKVLITGGPLAGFEAIHAGMGAGERELILLNLLGRQTPVKLAAGLVVPSP